MARLREALDRRAPLAPERVFRSVALPVADLVPFAEARTPGSYRLRTGDHRVALTLLPDEKVVLVTSLERKSDSTYAGLAARHDGRYRDR